MRFSPDLPTEKERPLQHQLSLLEEDMAKRMEDYEPERESIHWEDDLAHHHIEKAMGELSMAYSESKEGDSTAKMRREVADAVNHLLMALDIGAGDVELDDKGRRIKDN